MANLALAIHDIADSERGDFADPQSGQMAEKHGEAIVFSVPAVRDHGDHLRHQIAPWIISHKDGNPSVNHLGSDLNPSTGLSAPFMRIRHLSGKYIIGPGRACAEETDQVSKGDRAYRSDPMPRGASGARNWRETP